MKRLLIIPLLLLSLFVSAEKKGLVLPGKGHIDVEELKNGINLDMDVSQLNLGEVRVLRNAFYARYGYPFKDAYLRGVFASTTWYDSLMWAFDGDPDNFREVENREDEPWRDSYYRGIKPEATKIFPKEQAFIKRLQEREKELLKQNFVTSGGDVVNMDNIYNTMQLKDADPRLMARLGKKGFAIVPAAHNQLFHVYEANDYANFPNFITTDLFVQLYHLYFDSALRDIEEHRLDSILGLLCAKTTQAVGMRLLRETSLRLRDAAEWLQAYLAVASGLQSGKAQVLTGRYAQYAKDELMNANASEDNTSAFLGYTDKKFAYSLFRPRGHYTRSERLQRYFRTMMWLQTVPFGTDVPAQLDRALLLADIIGGDPALTALYRQMTEPITYLMGNPDNIDIMQVWQLMTKQGLPLAQLIADKKALADVRQQIELTAEKQTRIKPKYLRSSVYKINLMPQRYQPDAEVLQEMVDYDNTPPHRFKPAGLDVFAAMGVSTAERILIQEQHEADRWSGFLPMMERMKRLMRETDWQETIAKQWMKTLQTADPTSSQLHNPTSPQLPNSSTPYFMLSPEWGKKGLNTMLAGWAELKHDAILYAKQPMGAECGGAGPPDPVAKAYVEPNTGFWQKAIDLLNSTETVLRKYGLMTEKIEAATTDIREEAELLLGLSKKELAGERLKDEEYDQLAKIGSTFEYISLDLVREPDQYLMGWDDVQGPDRSVALVADVYTANADNNEDHKCILFEAVGQADEIYVIVEMDGMLYLTRGAVLSYREFDRPLDQQRLTDEEWQEYLKEHPRYGVPQWMEEIIVPLEVTPAPDEEFFYSSGC